jgi:uncharacterized C2H2 Zn-finger protein
VNLSLIIAIGVPLIIVVIIAIGVLLNRGKQLKCPDCDYVFNAPVMEQKITGLGLTFPYMGTIKCPKCNVKRSRRDYNKVEKLIKKA